MRPAIVMKAKFITPETKSRKDYSSYINYINREEALHKSEGGAEYFSNYIDYMNDRQKGAFAFDDKKDKLNQSDTLNKEKIFDDARRDNRVLWQDVYSFDNSFLEEQGIYNSKTESLDSKTMIQSVRESMNHYKKTNKINNLVWTGAIHRNTDNIHIHVASVNMDEDIVREDDGIQRGARTDKTLSDMKSKVINHLINRDHRLDKMTKQRDKIVKTDFLEKIDSKQKNQLDEIKSQLPDNKNKWSYNRKEMKHLQPLIDRYTNEYLKKNMKKEFEAYNKMLDEEVQLNKKLYGVGTKEYKKYERSKSNKLDELDERMGNALLKNLKEEEDIKKHLRSNEFYRKSNPDSQFKRKPAVNFRRVHYKPIINRRTQFMIERGFNNQYKDHQLEIENRQLEQKVEQEKSGNRKVVWKEG